MRNLCFVLLALVLSSCGRRTLDFVGSYMLITPFGGNVLELRADGEFAYEIYGRGDDIIKIWESGEMVDPKVGKWHAKEDTVILVCDQLLPNMLIESKKSYGIGGYHLTVCDRCDSIVWNRREKGFYGRTFTYNGPMELRLTGKRHDKKFQWVK